MTVRGVLIVLFDGVQSLDVTGPLEVFAGASSYRAGRGERGYEITTASLGGAPVTSASGLGLLPATDLRADAADPIDTLVVPGGRGTARPDPELIAWLRAHGPAARRITSVCTGAFLLAAAGLLDGRNATTHWAYAEALASQYPAVTVHTDPIFVRDGPVATSAGVTAGIDLALALVEEDMGHAAALAVARMPGGVPAPARRPGAVQRSPAGAVRAAGAAARRAAVDQRAPGRGSRRSRPWRRGPACHRASSRARSPPRPACRRAGSSARCGWRQRAGCWRTPAGASPRWPVPAATARPRPCAGRSCSRSACRPASYRHRF